MLCENMFWSKLKWIQIAEVLDNDDNVSEFITTGS
jgi:hypothetical protein